ncbi:hypothetical protein K458DRAFT_406475 [Lentithecium fluviatile CBS 122367]|uniref:BTB domain-containing protein n=1 Tax=Lentithecium fluviatile CBS 122367 TaxID=1168545 RepID=A0A6G1ITB4_9PLEO|nr:hypothetical protein K458DRAFT_406475 [Lentithecium fluviatile CBS 122367]
MTSAHITGHPWQDDWSNDFEEVTLKWNVHGVSVRKQALIGLSEHFKNVFATTHKDADLYDIAREPSKQTSAWVMTHMLPAIAYYCRQSFGRFQEPALWFGLHGFAELFDCSKLLEWCTPAVLSFAGRYYFHRTDDQFFYGIEDLHMPELAHELPDTHAVMRAVMIGECDRRVSLLCEAGEHKDALQRLYVLPWLAAEMFQHLEKALPTSIPTYDWKCAWCSTTFKYTRPPAHRNFYLPRCPGCACPGENLNVSRSAVPPIPILNGSSSILTTPAESSSSGKTG